MNVCPRKLVVSPDTFFSLQFMQLDDVLPFNYLQNILTSFAVKLDRNASELTPY